MLGAGLPGPGAGGAGLPTPYAALISNGRFSSRAFKSLHISLALLDAPVSARHSMIRSIDAPKFYEPLGHFDDSARTRKTSLRSKNNCTLANVQGLVRPCLRNCRLSRRQASSNPATPHSFTHSLARARESERALPRCNAEHILNRRRTKKLLK